MTHAAVQSIAATTGLLIFVGLAIAIVIHTFRKANSATYRSAASLPLQED